MRLAFYTLYATDLPANDKQICKYRKLSYIGFAQV